MPSLSTPRAPISPDMLSDADCLQRWSSAKDQAAFTLLVERYEPLVRGCAQRCLGLQSADSDEITQACFAILARKASSLDQQKALGPWLHTVASRLAWRCSKQRQRRQGQNMDYAQSQNASATTTATAQLEAAELSQHLDHALNTLPRQQRAAIILHYLQGLSHKEAAAKLRIPAGSFSRHLKAGLEKLKGKLKHATGLVLSIGLLEQLNAIELATNLSTSTHADLLAQQALKPSATIAKIAQQEFMRVTVFNLAKGALAASMILAAGYATYRACKSTQPTVPLTVNPNTTAVAVQQAPPILAPLKALSKTELLATSHTLNMKNTSLQQLRFYFNTILSIPIHSQIPTPELKKAIHLIEFRTKNMQLQNTLIWLSEMTNYQWSIQENGTLLISEMKPRPEIPITDGPTTPNEPEKAAKSFTLKNKPLAYAFAEFWNQPVQDILKDTQSLAYRNKISIRLHPIPAFDPGEVPNWYRTLDLQDALLARDSSHTHPILRRGLDFNYQQQSVIEILADIMQRTGVRLRLESAQKLPLLSYQHKNIAPDRLIQQICRSCNLYYTTSRYDELVLYDQNLMNPKKSVPVLPATLVLQPQIKDLRISVNWDEATVETVVATLEQQLHMPVEVQRKQADAVPEPILLKLDDYECDHITTILKHMPGYYTEYKDNKLILHISAPD